MSSERASLVATSNDGIRLPPVLSGTLVTRTVIIDSALLFLVTGALSDLQNWSYQSTGTLTVDEAREALLLMFLDYAGIVP